MRWGLPANHKATSAEILDELIEVDAQQLKGNAQVVPAQQTQ